MNRPPRRLSYRRIDTIIVAASAIEAVLGHLPPGQCALSHTAILPDLSDAGMLIFETLLLFTFEKRRDKEVEKLT
jgi:hypothetical protein